MEEEGLSPKKKIILLSGIAAAALIVVGALIGDPSVLGNFVILAIFAGVVPMVIYNYFQYLWLKAVEDHFPDFVRDLADSQRSGMSFPESLTLATKANYGKLTPLVKSMHNRLTWGVPMIRVLDIFHEQIKKSRIITEALLIVRESYQSGGNVAATLDAVSRDMVVLRETEAERSTMLRSQVMIMYGIFFMFMGIAIMVVYVMVPLIKATPGMDSTSNAGAPVGGASMVGFSFSDPCSGNTFFPCNYFSIIGVILGLTPGVSLYYISMFFTVVIIQAIFTGLIAGQIGQNSVTAGSKHMVLMVISSFAVFLFLAKAGVLPV
ncbi:MAG: type II secretion system F family protein [Nanoarchaeota archaeon]|nr:type II secretion system F family protein [Nanoarchaeota archaeon]